MLLQESDEEIRKGLERRLSGSADQDVRRFVDALQTRRGQGWFRQALVAVGEFVAASLLIVAGMVTLVPTVAGVDTASGLVQYFAEKTYGALGSTPLSPYDMLIEFALGALLLLAAFFTLRQAALTLREAGLGASEGD